MPVPADHEAYLAALPEAQAAALRALRARIRAIMPQAEEGISYALPAFRMNGKAVAGYSAARAHLTYLPFSGTVLAGLADRLEGHEWSKGGLRFSPEAPLSEPLLRAIIAARLIEIGA